MKLARNFNVDNGLLKVTVKWNEEAIWDSDKKKDKFESLVDDIYGVLKSRYHVRYIKMK